MGQQKFGRYEIRQELGHGGMGTVYHAYDPSFDRDIAIKIVPPQPHFRERFVREACAIARLEHPAIVPVYDVGEENGTPYLVMRYMTGGTLSSRIPAAGMTVEAAAPIVARIAAALDEAHARGIVHRDLKPGNILFDQRGDAYVSDFGIAKLLTESAALTGSGVIGTPMYMSPEQASGADLDGRSDIYSLGVMLYEMLTGRPPYESETPMAVAIKHLTDPIPDILQTRSDLPLSIAAIMQRALAKDPDQRYQTAGALAADLTAAAEGREPVRALQEPGTLPITLPEAAPLVERTRPRQTAPSPEPTSAPAAPRGTRLHLAVIGVVAVIATVAIVLAASTLLDRSEGNGALVSENLAGITSLQVDLALGATELTISAADSSSSDLEAVFTADPEVTMPTTSYEVRGQLGSLTINQEEPPLFVLGEDPMGNLVVQLPTGIPIDLTVDTGIGDTVLDLTGLEVRSLTIHGASGPTRIYLPEQGEFALSIEGTYSGVEIIAPEDASALTIIGFSITDSFGVITVDLPAAASSYEVEINAEALQVDFQVPENLAVSLDAPSSLVTVTSRSPRVEQTAGGTWQTPGFDDAGKQATIHVRNMMGTINFLP